MKASCKPAEHVSRRAFLKATLVGAGGAAAANFGGLFNSQTIADEARKKGKRCILLWMNGGASQTDTFDMKPEHANGGPFRPIASKVAGIQVSEYLPQMAKQVDQLAILRSMTTSEPDHPGGITNMHTGYRPEVNISHPEMGAMVAKCHGQPEADLPSFIRMGPCGNGGAGFLGPKYQPFALDRDGRLPYFTASYLQPDVEQRRNDLLRFMEAGFGQDHKADPFEAHRLAKEKSWKLLKAKGVFNIEKEWEKARDRYGDSQFGRGCLMARQLVEAGIPFVEVGQDNYDSHNDNFPCHKASLSVLDPAWAALLQDLKERGLLQDTLVVWMGEVGRTPQINNRAGRDHYINGWTIVLAGGGVRGGLVYGATNPDGRGVKDNPVTEGDLFATIYTTLGINPRTKHYVGPRPILAAPEKARVLKEILL